MNDWYHVFASPNSVLVQHSATFDIHSNTNSAAETTLNDFVIGAYLGSSIPLTLVANSIGGTITDCKFFRATAASNGHACSITTCNDYTFTRCHFGTVAFARSTGRGIFTSQCLDLTFNDCYTYNGSIAHNTSLNITHIGIDHNDRFVGSTNTTTGINVITCLTSCNNVYVDGVTFGQKGVVVDYCNPYLSVFHCSNSSNITYRNAGTRASPLRVASAALAPQYAFQDGGVNTNVLVQRVYLEYTRTNVTIGVNTSKNITLESVHGTVGAVQSLSTNNLMKGIRTASVSTSGGAAVYGSHFFDTFLSDTTGYLWFAMNEPTAFNEDYMTLTTGPGGGFTAAGQVSMPNLSDELIMETPYYVLGHTAFQNTAPLLTGTGTGNFSYEYDIDTGSGFTGTYNTLDGANLSAETLTSSTGFKLRIRVTTTSAVSTNALTYIRLATNSTLVAQESDLYPLDTVTMTITGYTVGSRIQIKDTTNTIELYNDVPVGSTITVVSPYTSAFDARVRVMYCTDTTANKIVEFTEFGVTATGFSRTITPETNQIYVDNAIDGTAITDIVFNDSLSLVEIDSSSGLISWGYIYAFETYWLSTEDGIRDAGRIIEAIDVANYLFDGFKVKNVTSGPVVPLVIANGWGRDSVTGETIDIIDTTGGSIFSNPDLVIAYETTGGGGATAADVWSYTTRELTAGGVTAIQAGIATSAEIAALNDLSAAEVNAEMDTALADYDGPTKSELDTAQTSIEANQQVINVGVQKASKLIPHSISL